MSDVLRRSKGKGKVQDNEAGSSASSSSSNTPSTPPRSRSGSDASLSNSRGGGGGTVSGGGGGGSSTAATPPTSSAPSSSGGGGSGSSSTVPAQPHDQWAADMMAELGLRQAQHGNAQPTLATQTGGVALGNAPRGKGASTSWIGKKVADALFGDANDRSAIKPEIASRIGAQRSDGTAAAVAITSSNGNKLKGNFFSADNYNLKENAGPGGSVRPDTSRPVALFLSGSGGSAEDYGTDIAEFYQKSGASVLAANYGGFGGSTDASDAQSRPSEQSCYEDAAAMLQHLLDLGYTEDKIIIHGYSLGGAVAGKLEAEFAQQGRKFRGLMLDRPMVSATSGVKGRMEFGKRTLAAAITRKTVGKMSARKAILASDSDTPMVISTDEGRFADDGDALRNKLKGRRAAHQQSGGSDADAPRQATGARTNADHFKHDEMLSKNGTYLQDLIAKDRSGATTSPPDTGRTEMQKKSSLELRASIKAKIVDCSNDIGTVAGNFVDKLRDIENASSWSNEDKRKLATKLGQYQPMLDRSVKTLRELQRNTGDVLGAATVDSIEAALKQAGDCQVQLLNLAAAANATAAVDPALVEALLHTLSSRTKDLESVLKLPVNLTSGPHKVFVDNFEAARGDVRSLIAAGANVPSTDPALVAAKAARQKLKAKVRSSAGGGGGGGTSDSGSSASGTGGSSPRGGSRITLGSSRRRSGDHLTLEAT